MLAVFIMASLPFRSFGDLSWLLRRDRVDFVDGEVLRLIESVVWFHNSYNEY